MPHYEFKNKETGEIMEMTLRISEYDEWKDSNPQWERYHSSSSVPQLISGTKSALTMAGKDWEGHLTNIKKNSGKDNTIKV
tara:strand:- start:528 stop:770 length:243 start_codon:yes stop_codon:yes gene_type:complete